MKKAERDDLRRLHEHFLASGVASADQYEDSRTILKLLSRIERLERALRGVGVARDACQCIDGLTCVPCHVREALGEES
jgi:hypothetical protein